MEITLIGEKDGKIKLDDSIFGSEVNKELLLQAVRIYQSALRLGTASTKGRGAVSGGGRKPWRQKGTGRARQGSTRSPVWVGGGVAHGPHPKDWSLKLTAKMKRAALISALSDKAANKNLHVVNSFPETIDKTGTLSKLIKSYKVEGRILIPISESEKSIYKFGKNIKSLRIIPEKELNAYEILKAKNVLLSKKTAEEISKNLKVAEEK